MSDHFTFRGQKYAYIRNLPNTHAERTVELPISLHLLEQAYKVGHRVLEVGYVTPLYPQLFNVHHEVLDKLDLRAGRVIDLLRFNPPYRYGTVVSISTVEHIGHNVAPNWDYGEPEDPTRALMALEHLRSLTAPQGIAMATFPIGFNPALDAELAFEPGTLRRISSLYKTFFMRRVSSDNRWEECSYDECKDAKFDTPYPCGNAICIAYWQNTRTP